jgi:WD40 repeat protein
VSGSQDEARPAQPAPSGVFERLASRPAVEGRLREEAEIARGGMGAILRVWDEDLRRTLAMKVSLARPGEGGTGSTDARLLHRFLEEAQITGQLEHPGIVPVHELGVDPDGRVFFTMPLVRGATLEQVFEKTRSGADGWSRTRALGVLLRVCEAMAFAHGKGVVHRDLKPANVMVGRFGETYVMDWGLARVLGAADRRDLRLALGDAGRSLVHTERADGRTPDSPLATMDGDVVGTPCYMPPEQARGEIEAIGPHSDVYAIGAMLYQLLAGHAPYLEPGASHAPLEVLRRLRDGAPVPIAARGVPEELVAICDKAMARDARARYASSAELADDLRAYLEDRVVRAHASGPVAEFRKWFARNRAAALAGSAAVVLAAAGLVATVLVQADANERLELAGDEAREARDAALSAKAELESANVELAQARDLELARRLALERSEYAANLAAAAAGLRLGDVAEARTRLEACAEPLRAWEWRNLWRAADAATRVLWEGDPKAVHIALHPSGEFLAVLFESGPLRLLRADDGSVVGEWPVADEIPGAIAFSPDGAVLARVAGDRSVQRLRLTDGEWLAPLAAQRRPITALAFSPDGLRLATAANDKSVRLWDVAGGAELAVLEAHSGFVTGLAFTPDGSGLVSGSRDRRVILWDTADGRMRREYSGCEQPVTFVAVSPDGSSVVAGTSPGELDFARAVAAQGNSVRVWDLHGGALRASLSGPGETITSGGFSADGRWLGAASKDGTVRLWDQRSGRSRSLVGHVGGALDLAPGPDGEWLASVDGSGRVLRWDVEVAQGFELRGHSGRISAVSFAPDGERLYSASLDQSVRAWSTAHGGLESVWRLPDFGAVHLALTPDGATLLSVQTDGAVRLLDPRSGRQRAVVGESPDKRMRIAQFAPAFALGPDGERYALAVRGAPVELRERESGAVVRGFERELDISVALAFDPAGRWLAHSELQLSPHAALLTVWDVESGGSLLRRVPPRQVAAFAAAPDGTLLACAIGRDVELVDTRDWSVRATLRGPGASVHALCFTPDGRRLVTGSSDGRLRVWDPAEGVALLTLEAPGGEVAALAFDARERLAIAQGDWSIVLWDPAPAATRAAARSAERTARAGVFELLDQVFAGAPTVEAALERLRADPTLETGALATALKLARLAGDDPASVWREGWPVVSMPGAQAEELHRTLWSASLARRTAPEDVEAALVLGAALLRLGRTEAALEVLLELERRVRETGPRGRVEVCAVLALALDAVGRDAEARVQADAARELMKIPTHAMRPDAQALMRELEVQLGD